MSLSFSNHTQQQQNSKKPRSDFQKFTCRRNYKKKLLGNVKRAVFNYSRMDVSKHDEWDTSNPMNPVVSKTTIYKLLTKEEIEILNQINGLFDKLNDNWRENHRKLVLEGYKK